MFTEISTIETHKKCVVISDFLTCEGHLLEDITIAYHCWGRLNQRGSNGILIVHGLTADSNAAKWWPGIIGKGCAFDPEKYFIICPNIPGSCYGSTSAENIRTKNPQASKRVQLSPQDIAMLFSKLLTSINIKNLHALAGASIGGFIALEYAIRHKHKVRNLLLIATSYYASPWNIAINEAQLMATECSNQVQALATARAIAMLSYRTPEIFNKSQADTNTGRKHKAQSYQRYQGEKLAQRFTLDAYRFMIGVFNRHNVANGRSSLENALLQIEAQTLIISISSDILFPAKEQKTMRAMIDNATLETIPSDYGHDGFLVENRRIGNIITSFLKGKNKTS
ncbi:MAG: alpha/beta fold hydrolase [Salinivirgaceae bacterium]|jgi:homoserine O-acetyltransferase|nr:alpha/beta fold hydrolase [Salinivirgaceae bacterium]